MCKYRFLVFGCLASMSMASGVWAQAILPGTGGGTSSGNQQQGEIFLLASHTEDQEDHYEVNLIRSVILENAAPVGVRWDVITTVEVQTAPGVYMPVSKFFETDGEITSSTVSISGGDLAGSSGGTPSTHIDIVVSTIGIPSDPGIYRIRTVLTVGDFMKQTFQDAVSVDGEFMISPEVTHAGPEI